jgi:uncharacterized protein YndB with AHSA1/START domain
MNERSVTHATFVLERTYNASPARVFAACSSRDAKARWFNSADGATSDHELDFRAGGRERVSGGPPGGPIFVYDAEIQDIVPDQRIVTTYEMYMDGTRISVSVATFELRPEGPGAHLTYTEQGAFLDGYDNADQREHGTSELLDSLGRELQRQTADVH